MNSLFEELGGTHYQKCNYILPALSVPELPAIGYGGSGIAVSETPSGSLYGLTTVRHVEQPPIRD